MLCDNSRQINSGIRVILHPGCRNKTVTKHVIITYSKSVFGSDKEDLYLCDECAELIGNAARRRGKEVHIEHYIIF